MGTLVDPSSSGSYFSAGDAFTVSPVQSRLRLSSTPSFNIPSRVSNDSLLLPFDRNPRSASNPFEMVFDPQPRMLEKPPSNDSIFASRTSLVKASYQDIDNAINKGKRHPSGINQLHQPNMSSKHPIITIVDQSSLRRNHSVISNSASLRHRNTIKSRNKMVRRNDLPHDKEDNNGKKKIKKETHNPLSFLFPVKRKTSLKYNSLRQKTKPLFSNNEELQAFLKQCNADEMIRDIIPRTMKTFQYNKLLKVKPKLQFTSKLFEIDNRNNFKIAPINSITISEPVTKPPKTHTRQLSHVEFRDIVYQKYKNAVFANKVMTVPKFQDMFPYDTSLLTSKEINQINKNLLFEILIRRTVAAKIGYRLQQNNSAVVSSSTSSSYSSGDSSAPDENPRSRAPKNTQQEEDKDYKTGSESGESINTEELMQHNASLFSGLLPSPQISYTSNIFGSIYLPTNQDYDNYGTDRPPAIPSSSKDSKSVNSSGLDPRSATQKSPPTKEPEVSSPQSLYVNDFNKAYKSKYPKNLGNVEETLSTSNVYQLKPMNRSTGTLSSSEEGPKLVAPPAIFQDSSSKSTKSNKSILTKESRRSKPMDKRPSDSTTHTSIFQNLEDLSSDITSYLNDSNEYPKEESAKEAVPVLTHTPLIASSFSQPNVSQQSPVRTSPSLIESINKAGQETKDVKGSPQTILQRSPHYDIKSMKGSISVAGSHQNTALSSTPTNSIVQTSEELDRIDERPISPSKSAKSSDYYTNNPNLVIARQDSNSTRSMISSHARDHSLTGTVKTDYLIWHKSNH
ncbi:uncharacterized protein RJT20DRAFT_63041 [Scheffersomyces xylosifermentans]|uniref:uncharacterized protein n=1 Tax=Scheffersomyces xylosifermentans TaxID=1304137 RepID=UPI00315D999F